jgi:AcrR family transcriptional regulator
MSSQFERARSTEAKQERERAILESAARLAGERGVRAVTLTDIAAGVGMHKSTMLRYFETREEIYLRLAATGWSDWSAAVVTALRTLPTGPDGAATARLLAATLVQRPLFCDLLAHVPLNLERGVSLATVKEFKIEVLGAVATVATALEDALGLDPTAALNVVATATSMAGALWQMAAPGTKLRELYQEDPELVHALVDVEPRLVDILTALIAGYPPRSD